ncbi:response regulator [Actinoplanes sp. DH11]|uniref:response regulator n=1 Tax=Actinoplanes sp. DH11 TaxID=2857011 RepID=UPI001E3335F2|nr:response regulator [Actinoplanes sp. DH11]
MGTELFRSAGADNEKPVVLLVDDEETVLQTLALQLGREHQLLTAGDGVEALRVLAEHGQVAAVVSDMRMPGMDGIELLRRIQIEYPDTTRVLHTGHGDIETAIAAINSGGVYRYLPKPAGTDELRSIVDDAVARHSRAMAERELLDKTLRTSVQALFGCLELASPVAFARAGRIRALVAELCHELQLVGLWEIEVAAMASQLGAVTVPPAVLKKLDRGVALGPDEQAMVNAMPRAAVRLLRDIPMLHDVVEIVQGLAGEPAPESGRSALVEAGINVVRTAIDFEIMESRSATAALAIGALEERGDGAAHVLAALRKVKGVRAHQEVVKSVRIMELEVGMRLAEDVVAVNGLVLIGRGTVATEVMLDRLTNFARVVDIVEPVLAAVPDYHRYLVRSHRS